VRFDGGHKRDPFLVESLGPFVEWLPVCPEFESGLGAPRETAQDHTRRRQGYARRRVEDLGKRELCGFVLKKDSPACGLGGERFFGDRCRTSAAHRSPRASRPFTKR
jgi:uncharacterized protein YbbK (DUF523 family)